MFLRSLFATGQLILLAAATGCGTSTGREAEAGNPAPERRVAAVQKVGAGKAAQKKTDDGHANSYVKIKVDVELRGVLSFTEEKTTLAIDQQPNWVLDFDEDNEARVKAKDLNGKTIVVTGYATLQHKTQDVSERPKGLATGRGTGMTVSVLDLEPKCTVKRLTAATKE
ncbi:hypothetical protein [Fimbriiglobus ruber]|uniref:Lipoprotein n=1 Tax=Fimbriiglobus ruber TaxID=1908690 RepID=A0A225E0J4_9BACT|nr:hypothetical protein [Fimbriiglobus ruber]OWK46723.1 hypothetical protein FRUB_00422 [Fimbriiglobus ruber]